MLAEELPVKVILVVNSPEALDIYIRFHCHLLSVNAWRHINEIAVGVTGIRDAVEGGW